RGTSSHQSRRENRRLRLVHHRKFRRSPEKSYVSRHNSRLYFCFSYLKRRCFVRYRCFYQTSIPWTSIGKKTLRLPKRTLRKTEFKKHCFWRKNSILS